MVTGRSQNVILNDEIRPVNALLNYNLLSVALMAVVLIAVIVAVVLFGSTEGIIIITLAVNLVLLVPSFIWAVLSHRYLRYRFTESETEWKRGIMFRATGIVPYCKIAHIKIVQGPIMRLFGLHTLKMQTAGSTGTQGTDPEIRVEGLDNYCDYRTFILNHIPTASGGERVAEAPGSASERTLEELVKIRELLEAGAGPRSN